MLFWLIYAYDSELIYSKHLKSIIPSWQNHLQHTLPFITAIIDNCLFHHPYPKFLKGIWPTVLFSFNYLAL